MTTLTANSAGVVSGKFTVPANINSGIKQVHFLGAGGSFADANFVGQGVIETRTLQEQVSVETVLTPAPLPIEFRGTDPLAQTFSLPAANQIGAVELWVTDKGATPIMVQIRETQVGFPTQKVLAEAQKAPANITTGAWNRWNFPRPVPLLADVEYAIVVLCNDTTGAVAVAELGKFDSSAQQWITSQPYQVGVLLSSSNAATWTAHQDRDLTFRLLAARYTETVREINLGNVALSAATELVVLALADQPAADAGAEVVLTLPDSTTLTASDGQVIALGSSVTGTLGVKARLHANGTQSAVLAPGTQIVTGAVATSADYITRAFEADATGADVRIIFDANLPSGASVAVFVSGTDAGDTWQSVAQVGTAKAVGDGYYEFQYLKTDLNEANIRVKLVLTGTIAARPFVKNLRVSVT